MKTPVPNGWALSYARVKVGAGGWIVAKLTNRRTGAEIERTAATKTEARRNVLAAFKNWTRS